MNILLVEPAYRSRYPPLGLLKIASLHRLRGDKVKLVRGCTTPNRKPDLIYVTSLFTWAWRPVWNAVGHYKESFPRAEVWLGGLYASLMPEHAKLSGADRVHSGIYEKVEDLMPAYDLVPDWDGSIVFSSRGCNRRCPYCGVWRVEGSINSAKRTIKHLVYPKHTRVILWDNNFLQSPYWREILDELVELGRVVDFNQGVDARLINGEAAERLSNVKLKCLRISYDHSGVRVSVRRAIREISSRGLRRRSILTYVLYNFKDDPNNFFQRVRDVLDWGAVVYPMRYEPLDSLERWKFVSPKWDAEKLEIVEDFRRVYGYGGAFPPYRWLVERFRESESFDEAFRLPEEGKHKKRVRKPYHDGWQRENDWRKVAKRFLSKKW